MSEYIEREALLKHAIALNNPHELGENVVPVSDIEAAPAADVAEVVRCGKCIYGRPHKFFKGFRVCERCGKNSGEAPFTKKPSDFCSYGEKENT